MHRQFADRTSAGRELAAKLEHLRGRNAIVLGLPRGGLPVAYEVACALGAPLDILNVRKLGVPWHEELAMGAIGTGGVRVLNSDIMLGMGITPGIPGLSIARSSTPSQPSSVETSNSVWNEESTLSKLEWNRTQV